MTEQDPGTGGKKLSKSGDSDAKLEARNKSYHKVLDSQIDYLWAKNAQVDNVDEFRRRWLKKSEWHEKEFGW